MLFVGNTYRQRQNGSEECALIIARQLAQHRLQNRLELEGQKTHNQCSQIHTPPTPRYMGVHILIIPKQIHT